MSFLDKNNIIGYSLLKFYQHELPNGLGLPQSQDQRSIELSSDEKAQIAELEQEIAKLENKIRSAFKAIKKLSLPPIAIDSGFAEFGNTEKAAVSDMVITLEDLQFSPAGIIVYNDNVKYRIFFRSLTIPEDSVRIVFNTQDEDEAQIIINSRVWIKISDRGYLTAVNVLYRLVLEHEQLTTKLANFKGDIGF